MGRTRRAGGRHFPVKPATGEQPESGSAKIRNWVLTTVAVLGLLGAVIGWLDGRIDALDQRIDGLSERLTAVEVLLEVIHDEVVRSSQGPRDAD